MARAKTALISLMMGAVVARVSAAGYSRAPSAPSAGPRCPSRRDAAPERRAPVRDASSERTPPGPGSSFELADERQTGAARCERWGEGEHGRRVDRAGRATVTLEEEVPGDHRGRAADTERDGGHDCVGL